jgi:electron transport complex protein RnfD
VALTSWIPGFTAGRFAALPPSTLTPPFTQPTYVDAWTMATPLSQWKFDRQVTEVGDLAMGFISGSTGETCSLLILLGGIYLIARNMMNWRIPAAIFATVAVFSGALHLADPERYASPLFMLFSGGLMLGAMFMATDMVGSPLTGRGCVLYGVLIGVLVVVIRVWGGMPEGVMYAILLANAVAPHIDRLVRPRVYGTSGDAR